MGDSRRDRTSFGDGRDGRDVWHPAHLATSAHPAHPAFSLLLPLLLVACGSGKTPLVVYSPHGRELLSIAESTFEAAHPDVDVQWLDMGSQDVLDRVRSERANPQADVWYGGPSSLFDRAVTDSLLQPYRPTWAAHTPARGHGPNDLYYALYETPAVIAYNSDAVSADSAPKDWDDVLKPKWKNEVLIRDPLASGTMRAIWGMIIERGLRKTGDTAAGFQWLRRLDAQTAEYTLNPALLYQKLVRQDGLVTLWDLPDILLAESQHQPIGFTLPTSGTPVIEDAIAIPKGAPHPKLARAFEEWVGTPQMQLVATRRAYRLPARTDLPADSLPAWAQRVDSEMVVEPMDWKLLAEQGANWMSYWDRNVRGRGAARP